MASPAFLIPSVNWYGLPPGVEGVMPADGVAPLATGWGGALTTDDDVRAVLLTIEPVLLLLTLAGYQVPEVAIGIPAGTQPTPAGELVVVRPETMRVEQGTARTWMPFVVAAAVGLWVVPRYPVAPPADASGPTLTLDRLAGTTDPAAVELPDPDPAGAWLRLVWEPAAVGSWPGELAALVQGLSDALVEELDRQRTLAYAADPDDMVVPLCGLLGLYDPRTWREPAQLDPTEPLTAYVGGFGDRLTAILDGDGGFKAFLERECLPVGDGEADPPEPGPPSVVARWLDGASEDQQAEIVDDLSFVATELEIQTYDAPLVDERALGFQEDAYLSMQQLSVTQALLFWQEVGALDFLFSIYWAVDEIYGIELYGGWALRKGDDDARHVYEGAVRTERLPAVGEKGHVARLREDLAELGFGPQFSYAEGEPDAATFDVDLERAVREFQIAASSAGLAQYQPFDVQVPFYADKLIGVDNPDRYTGPISGVVNGRTRGLIQQWLNQDLRCPVIIEARVNGTAGPFSAPFAAAGSDNLWRHDQVTTNAPRMFVRDFSRDWEMPPAGVPAGESLHKLTLGEYTLSPFGNGPWSNPPQHVWPPGSEILPETLIGAAWNTLTPEARSTFRVVRNVAEIECIGYFDCWNAYDDGVFSGGPCHWTIALLKGGKSLEAELPPYFAYLKGLGGDAEAAYEAAVGRFGCGSAKAWPAGTAGATSPCWSDDHRKYAARMTLEDDDGRAVALKESDLDGPAWFREWHWLYRLAMAGRTVEAYRRHMWDYARLRVRDVRAASWVPGLVMGNGGNATVGDLFTSERAAAVIHRWHVNRPSDLMPLDPARRAALGLGTSKLKTAFDNAGAAAWGDPLTWTDAREEHLCDALYDLGKAAGGWLRDSLVQAYEWPNWWIHNNLRKWSLGIADVLPTPVFTAAANAQTAVGTAVAVPVPIDWRGAPGLLEARAADSTLLPPAGIVLGGVAPAHVLTLTPAAGKTGRTTVTVIADNSDGRAELTFTLTVGAPGGPAPPAPAGVAGSSKRRGSFRFDGTGLP